jgi:HSP20 family protein
LSSSRRAGGDAGGINKNKRRMSEEQLKDIQTRVPKEIVREYQTPEDSKVKKIGPQASTTIGPDGKLTTR